MTFFCPSTSEQLRHVRKYRISAGALLDFFRQLDGRLLVECETEIPADAKVVGLKIEGGLNTFAIYVESETFEKGFEGEEVMEHTLDFRTMSPEPGEPDGLYFRRR